MRSGHDEERRIKPDGGGGGRYGATEVIQCIERRRLSEGQPRFLLQFARCRGGEGAGEGWAGTFCQTA
jgi:hypothetical protein